MRQEEGKLLLVNSWEVFYFTSYFLSYTIYWK